MMRNQWHALIYTDGYIAITMYERCYAMWYFKAYNRKIAGVVGGGALHTPGEWRLDAASLKKIGRVLEKRKNKLTCKGK